MTYPIRSELALAIPLLFGCAEIDPIAQDVCGNHVVEPHVHEECDAPTGCGAPETPAACRFTCEGGAPCPDGYRCGVDSVCRKPSGAFELIGQSELDFNRDLVVRDADGDGRDDVLHVAAERSFLEFYGDGGALETTSPIGQVPLVLPSAVIEDLNADGLREVAINVEGLSFFVSALAVYRLQPDRSFEGTVYASLAIPGSSLRATRAQVLPPSFDDEVLAFVDGMLVGVDRGVDPEPLAHGTAHTADDLEGMVAARFDEAAPCDRLAVVDAGGSSISLINPCIVAPGPLGEPEVRWRQQRMDPPDVTTVTLPASVIDYTELGSITFGYRALRQALFAADWNNDDHVDLIAVPLDNTMPTLFVAYGQGDGTFHSAPIPTAGSDGLATTVDLTLDYPSVAFPCGTGVGPGKEPVAFGVPVLGLADFDGDAALDLVREDGVYLRGGPPRSPTCGIGWLSVEIDDFDGNGTKDVAASRFGSTSIDYLGGAGNGSFARTTINTPGLVMQLMAGDYDGDLVSDIAFFEAILGGEGIETSLGIAYGRGLGGAPELPVTVARIDGIAHLSSARFLRGDSISDLAVLAQGDSSQALALVAGNSRRELSAPFLLNLAVGGAPDPIPQSIDVVTTGSFGEGRGPIVAMTRDDFAQNPGNRNRPWLLNASADEEITPELSSTYQDPEQGLSCNQAVHGIFGSCPTAAVDLDADGIDELVVFAGDTTDPGKGIVHTMVLGETGFDIASTLDIGQVRVEANDVNANPTRALVADLDGDGLRDILVDGVDVLATTSVLLAFYNNGDGTLTAPVTVPTEAVVRAVALIELDGDPEVEFAVGTESSLEFWEATTDRTLAPIEDEIEISGVPPEPLHVASGDVDGDGVQDLVVAGFYRYAVLRGIPITP